MTQPQYSVVFQELADIATCSSGDFHALHFNMRGLDFDQLHAKILKKYYEAAADDADEFGEWSVAFDEDYAVKNQNEAASRISYQSLDAVIEDRDRCIAVSRIIIENICANYLKVFKALEKENCPMCIGAANLLQSRLEYWAKELGYFNTRRKQ